MKNYRKAIKSKSGNSQKKARTAKQKAQLRAEFHEKVRNKGKKETIFKDNKIFI